MIFPLPLLLILVKSLFASVVVASMIRSDVFVAPFTIKALSVWSALSLKVIPESMFTLVSTAT